MNRLTPMLLLAAALPLAACGADDSAADSAGFDAPATPGASGVAPAGAQDFGLFRRILEHGDLPHPDTLDPLGFFAEHKLDYPAPDCGDDICLHALLGVGENLMTGNNCTLLQIGLNSPIDPGAEDRPPLDLVLAVDTSGSMRGEAITWLITGLRAMLPHLRAQDRVSLVAYDDIARVLVEAIPGDDRDTLEAAIAQLTAGGATNLYDGLFTALQIADAARAPGREARVLFLSDGDATQGLEAPARLEALAAAYARRGIGITTIGIGRSFDVATMRAISDTGAGNFYFLEDPSAVVEVFTEEVQTFLVPLALDARVDVVAGDGYVVRGAYGVRDWQGGLYRGTARQASLFLAGRQRAQDPVAGGRRGGGGAILVELMPRGGSDALTRAGRVGTVTLSWTDPVTLEPRSQQVDVDSPYAPTETPAELHASHATARKGFVMLNVLVGFQLAAELALEADYGTAISLLSGLEAGLDGYLRDNPDPDLEDDALYVTLFRQNLEDTVAALRVQTPPEPPPPHWVYD
ncbi:MAG: VWA domain-containing protein [bacterium]